MNRAELIQSIERFNPEKKVTDALTPPASWYRWGEFEKLEESSVFTYALCLASAMDCPEPGSFKSIDFYGFPILLLRNEEGLKAFHNTCSHHGTCVARGEGHVQELTCPYHGWKYDLNGKLLKTPMAGGIKDLRQKNLNLKEIEIELVGPFVFFHLGKARNSPGEMFKGLFESISWDGLNRVHEVRYEMDCNWKVFVDNYLDGGYHVPHMHPDLALDLDLDSYQTEIEKWYSLQTCSGIGENRVGEKAYYGFCYPNFMFNRYGKWLDTNLALPLGPERCQVIFQYYYEGEITKKALDQALAQSHQVQLEDMEVCHMVQKGLKSPAYDQGVYAPKFEGPMYEFHRRLYEDFKRELERGIE